MFRRIYRSRWFITFFCIMLTWVFFQPSMTKSMAILERMFHLQLGNVLPLPSQSLWMICLGFVLVHLLNLSPRVKDSLRRVPAPLVGLSYALLLSFSLLIMPHGEKTFIYFQF